MGHSESKCSVKDCKSFLGEYAVLACGHLQCYAHAQQQRTTDAKKSVHCALCGGYRPLRTYWLRCGCQTDSLDGFEATTELHGSAVESLALRCKNKHVLHMIDVSTFFRVPARQLVLDHMDRLLQKGTVVSLILHENAVGDEGAAAVASLVEKYPSVRTVDLSQNMISQVGAKAVAEALQKPEVKVSTLDFAKNYIGAEGAKVFAEAIKKSQTLAVLRLNGNSIEDEGVESIAAALESPDSKLAQLDLTSNRIQEKGAVSLSTSLKKNSTLVALVLSHNQIGDKGLESLSDMLTVNHVLAKLAVSDNRLTAAGAVHLSKALAKNSSCQELDLHKNFVGDKGAAALAETMRVLEVLNLEKNGISSEGAKKLAESPGFKTLVSLNLRENNVADEGAKCIAEPLGESKAMACLILYHCNIGDAGAGALASALDKNASLKVLDLSFNHITEEGAKAIAHTIEHNTCLETLDLSYNFKVGAMGAKALGRALGKNVGLRMLNLRDNKLGDLGARSMAAALEENHTLLTLILLENSIGAEGVRAIAGSLEKNRGLAMLDLSGNSFGDEGIRALASSLAANTVLTALPLGYDKFSEEGLKDMDRLKACLRRNAEQQQDSGHLKIPESSPSDAIFAYRRRSSGVEKASPIRDFMPALGASEEPKAAVTLQIPKEKQRKIPASAARRLEETIGFWVHTEIWEAMPRGSSLVPANRRVGQYVVEEGHRILLLKTYSYSKDDARMINLARKEFEDTKRLAKEEKCRDTVIVPICTKEQTDDFGVTHIETLFEWPGDSFISSRDVPPPPPSMKSLASWMHASLKLLQLSGSLGIRCTGLGPENMYYSPDHTSFRMGGFSDPCGCALHKSLFLRDMGAVDSWRDSGCPPDFVDGKIGELEETYVWAAGFCQLLCGGRTYAQELEKSKGNISDFIAGLLPGEEKDTEDRGTVKKALEAALAPEAVKRANFVQLLEIFAKSEKVVEEKGK